MDTHNRTPVNLPSPQDLLDFLRRPEWAYIKLELSRSRDLHLSKLLRANYSNDPAAAGRLAGFVLSLDMILEEGVDLLDESRFEYVMLKKLRRRMQAIEKQNADLSARQGTK